MGSCLICFSRIKPNAYRIDLEDLTNGAYLIKVYDFSSPARFQNLIKQWN